MNAESDIDAIRRLGRSVCDGVDGTGAQLVQAAEGLVAIAKAFNGSIHSDVTAAAGEAKIGLDRLSTAIRRMLEQLEEATE